MYTSFCIPSRSLVFASLILSSLILHHRLLTGFCFLPTTSVREFRGDPVPLGLSPARSEAGTGVGDGLGVSDFRFESLEETDFTGRVTERILLGSASRGADVGAGAFAVLALPDV